MDIPYWGGAFRSLIRNAVRRPDFFRDLATAGLRADSAPAAETVDLLTHYPEVESIDVDLGVVRFRRSNLDPMEQHALAALAKLKKPRRIFEIGTYDGATTLLLARNAPDAEIFTLDLPAEVAHVATVDEEVRNASEAVGSRFAGTRESARITQLLGDSRTFDFSSWCGTVDLVLVDAGHDYEMVRSDTLNALRLISAHGIVVWDDYTVGWPGVVRAVDEAGIPVIRLAGTDFAIYERR